MSKWLKFVGVFAVVGLVMAVIAGVALAQGPVDEDGDGACDLCGEQVSEGVMRGWRFNQNVEAQMEGRGPFADDNEMPCDDYVDEDGDGVCDNHDDAIVQPNDGRGTRGGMRGGRMQDGQGRP